MVSGPSIYKYDVLCESRLSRQGSLNEDDSGHLSIPVWKDQGQKSEEPIDVGQMNWTIKAAQVICHRQTETSSLKSREDNTFSI